MILLKSKNFNNNFKQILKDYNNGNTNYYIKCPKCNSTHLISHGYYKRNLIYEYNHMLIKTIVTIKRVKCKSCGLTHALLPIDIISYKKTSFRVIIKCLFNDNYFNNSFFSYDTKEKWFRHFKIFMPYIIDLQIIYISFCKCIFNFPFLFKRDFKFEIARGRLLVSQG